MRSNGIMQSMLALPVSPVVEDDDEVTRQEMDDFFADAESADDGAAMGDQLRASESLYQRGLVLSLLVAPRLANMFQRAYGWGSVCVLAANSNSPEPTAGNGTIARSLDRSLERSIVRSIARSLARSLARSIDRLIDRSLNRSFGHSLERSLDRSITRLIARWFDHSLNRSIARSIARSCDHALVRSCV